MGLQEDLKHSRDTGNWAWDPYAQRYDLIVASAELDSIEDAARTLHAAIGSLPGWVTEELGLDEVADALDNAHIEEEA